MASFDKLLSPFRTRRLAMVLCIGFASGLPLSMTASLLSALLTDAQLDIKKIAALASVGLPYTLKFLWAPLLDRYRLPFLGRRRGWLVTLQVGLAAGLIALGQADPIGDLPTFVALAFTVSTLAASQDIVVDAYNNDLLGPEQRAAGIAAYTLGYRIALLVTGTFALGAADYLPWSTIYAGVGGLMLLCTIATVLAEEPAAPRGAPRTLAQAVARPLADIFRRDRLPLVVTFLVFVVLYKFGDVLIDVVKLTFYKEALGFKWLEIAGMSKVLGFVAVILGGSLAGVGVPRLGLRRALLVFGALQAATNLLYALLAVSSKSFVLLGVAVLADNIAGAAGAATFVAYLMSQTRPEYSATQMALYTGLSSVGARVFGWLAGELVAGVGWAGFFAITAVIAVPGLVLATLIPLRDRREAAPGEEKST